MSERTPSKTQFDLHNIQWAQEKANSMIFPDYREYVMAAALIYDGQLYAAKHHATCYHELRDRGIKFIGTLDEGTGFLTNTGRYIDREEAEKLAIKRGQLVRTDEIGIVYSEDLW